MKNINEIDPVKQAIRRKMAKKSVYSEKDAVIWEKVLSEIQEEPKVFKINHTLLYAAATLLLFITVSLGYFIQDKPEHISISQKGQQVPVDRPEEINTNGEKPVTKTELEDISREIPIAENKSEDIVPVIADPAFNSVAVHAATKILEHKLPDGSVATLNMGSTIKSSHKFSNNRNVSLEGEAYFEVKSDTENPFTVYFSDYKLVVVGTKFNIRNVSGESGKEVTVTEGIVRVYDNIQKEGIVVKKGEQVRLSKGEETILLEVDSPNYISWKTGNLNFRKSDLEEITRILSRKYNTEIAFSPEVKKCKFTGDLSGLELDEVLSIISKTISLKVEKTNNKIYISGPGCD